VEGRLYALPDGASLTLFGHRPSAAPAAPAALQLRRDAAGDDAAAAELASDAGAAVVTVGELPARMRALQEDMIALLELDPAATRRLTIAIDDPGGSNEASIMFGVCSGQKAERSGPYQCQLAGQYNTGPDDKFLHSRVPQGTGRAAHKQQAAHARALVDQQLKATLMGLIHQYTALAEEELRRAQPVLFRKQARLRELLGRHRVLARPGDPCALRSAVFTNGYVSVSRRATTRHTDYRNPSLTHLSTRALPPRPRAPPPPVAPGKRARPTALPGVTGQLVFFERTMEAGIVVQDSLLGRQVMGGLNLVAHANMLPPGM
jgi:hypothetical protein